MTDRQTDGRTDRRTELRWLRRAIAVPAVARNKSIEYIYAGLTIILLTVCQIVFMSCCVILGYTACHKIKYKYFFPPPSLLLCQTATGSTGVYLLLTTKASHLIAQRLRAECMQPAERPACIWPRLRQLCCRRSVDDDTWTQ